MTDRRQTVAVDSGPRTCRAWAAGFYDGEGSCIFTSRTSRTGATSCALAVTVTQSITPRPLWRFLDTVGVGKVQGPYLTSNLRAKPYWAYRASGLSNVRRIVAVLWPWLGEVKREQFDTAIMRFTEFIPEFQPCRHGSIYAACRPCHSEAAAKGWETRRAAS